MRRRTHSSEALLRIRPKPPCGGQTVQTVFRRIVQPLIGPQTVSDGLNYLNGLNGLNAVGP